MSGWICLHKKITEWRWYSDANCFRFFVHLLLKANYKDNYFGETLVKRGQLAISREKLSAQLGLTIKQIRLVESKLEKDRTLVSKRATFFMVYTIVKYEDYQKIEDEKANESQEKVKRKSKKGQHKTIEQEYNNIYAEKFSEFWKLYPRKKSKANAEKIFHQLLKKGTDYEAIMAGVKDYNEECRGKDEKYIAHAATWLNGRRWEDEKTKEKKISLEELSVVHIEKWLSEKRASGKYLLHDPEFILEQFKNYCQANGKKYKDYIAALRNAFEWDRFQPQKQSQANNDSWRERNRMKNPAGG